MFVSSDELFDEWSIVALGDWLLIFSLWVVPCPSSSTLQLTFYSYFIFTFKSLVYKFIEELERKNTYQKKYL